MEVLRKVLSDPKIYENYLNEGFFSSWQREVWERGQKQHIAGYWLESWPSNQEDLNSNATFDACWLGDHEQIM